MIVDKFSIYLSPFGKMVDCCLSALERCEIVMRCVLLVWLLLQQLHCLHNLIVHWQLLSVVFLLVNLIHLFLVVATVLPVPLAMFQLPISYYLFVQPKQVCQPPEHGNDQHILLAVDPPPGGGAHIWGIAPWTCIPPAAETEDCSLGRTAESTLLDAEAMQRRCQTLMGERNHLILEDTGGNTEAFEGQGGRFAQWRSHCDHCCEFWSK